MATQLDINIINTHNPKTLGIADTSMYDINQAIVSPTIEITPPNFNKVGISFNPHQVNIINSNTINLTNTLDSSSLVPLPDGIWQIKYSISPASKMFINKKFFRTDKIENKYFEVFLSIDMLSECNDGYCLPTSGHRKKQIDQSKEIKLMINGAISAANKGEDKLALTLYQRADSMLDRFNVCQTCN